MQKAKNRLLKTVMVAAFATTVFSGTLATPAFADEITDWKRSIYKLVAKKQVYPRSAINRQIEGDAKVKVTIDRTGAVQGFDILQETGHAILDKQVPKLIKRIDPVPPPPSSVSDEQLSFVLPLSWVLQ